MRSKGICCRISADSSPRCAVWMAGCTQTTSSSAELKETQDSSSCRSFFCCAPGHCAMASTSTHTRSVWLVPWLQAATRLPHDAPHAWLTNTCERAMPRALSALRPVKLRCGQPLPPAHNAIAA